MSIPPRITPPVEADRPRVDRVDSEVRAGPRIAGERRADGVLGLGLDYLRHAIFVGEGSAQDDETRVDEPVHERRVLGPAGLLLQRLLRVPLWAGAMEHDEEDRHARVLPLPGGEHAAVSASRPAQTESGCVRGRAAGARAPAGRLGGSWTGRCPAAAPGRTPSELPSSATSPGPPRPVRS